LASFLFAFCQGEWGGGGGGYICSGFLYKKGAFIWSVPRNLCIFLGGGGFGGLISFPYHPSSAQSFKTAQNVYLNVTFSLIFFHPPTHPLHLPLFPSSSPSLARYRLSLPFTIFRSFRIVRVGFLCLGWGRRGKVELGGEGRGGEGGRGKRGGVRGEGGKGGGGGGGMVSK